jgi:N-acetylneuraminate synthase
VNEETNQAVSSGNLIIDGRDYSENHCLIVGEVGQAHDGSVGMAHAFIDAIADAGAGAVKFQTHIAAAESTPAESWRVKFSSQDATRYDYWKRMEFSEQQWLGLKRHASERELVFLSSPFSLEAVKLLQRVGVPAWKVASGEVGNTQLLRALGDTGLPVILSSGMSPLAEIDAGVALLKSYKVPLAVMQCTSSYPCPPEKVGLNMIEFFRSRYDCAVGLSDHSGTVYPGLAAAALGIDVLEVHVTLSREMFGPDVKSSITSAELAQMVEGIRFIEKILANPLDKNTLADELSPLRDMFTKSVVTRVPLAAGTILLEQHLTLKKPGTGIPASRASELIGLKLLRAVAADELLHADDIAWDRTVSNDD